MVNLGERGAETIGGVRHSEGGKCGVDALP